LPEPIDRIALLTLAYRGVYDYDTTSMQRFVAAVGPLIAADERALVHLGELTDLFAIYADPWKAERYGGRERLKDEVIAALQALIARLPD
jgi:hypothetical protein